MKTQGEHIRTLRRRVDFLKARDYRNSYDQAELGALEWALVNLPPAQRQWVDLPDEEIKILWVQYRAALPRYLCFAKALLQSSKEKNT